MKKILVANSDGRMPKGFLEQLKSISKLDWHYDEVAKCFYAEIDNEKEAKFQILKQSILL